MYKWSRENAHRHSSCCTESKKSVALGRSLARDRVGSHKPGLDSTWTFISKRCPIGPSKVCAKRSSFRICLHWVTYQRLPCPLSPRFFWGTPRVQSACLRLSPTALYRRTGSTWKANSRRPQYSTRSKSHSFDCIASLLY